MQNPDVPNVNNNLFRHQHTLDGFTNDVFREPLDQVAEVSCSESSSSSSGQPPASTQPTQPPHSSRQQRNPRLSELRSGDQTNARSDTLASYSSSLDDDNAANAGVTSAGSSPTGRRRRKPLSDTNFMDFSASSSLHDSPAIRNANRSNGTIEGHADVANSTNNNHVDSDLTGTAAAIELSLESPTERNVFREVSLIVFASSGNTI